MVFESKSGRASDMTTPGPGRLSLNDSLEPSDWYQAKTAAVEPEDYPNGDVNSCAFSSDDKCLGPFPSYVINLLSDKSDWKNRTSGVTKMQTIISKLPKDYSLEPHLDTTLELATSTLSDPHFKVSQLGLELIARIVAKAGISIRPFLPSLVQIIISKVGSNKFVLKKAGLQVLMELMVALRPQPVITEMVEFGLKHKTSRVREETLNAIIMALLQFPMTEFSFSSLVKDLIPIMGDSKSRVRQASFEAVALLCSMDPDAIKESIATITSLRNSTTSTCKYSNRNGLTLMDAFQTRLARQVVPKMNGNGLVEHVISVSNSKSQLSVSGADVDWILSAGGIKSQTSSEACEQEGSLPQAKQRRPSVNNGVASSSRPYRSAGKRLPWEVEGEDLVRTQLTMPVKELAPLPNPLSPKHVFTPPPASPSSLTTPRKTTYSDMFKAKKASSQKPLSLTQSLATVQPPAATGPWSNGGVLSNTNERGQPLFTSRHASVSEDQSRTVPPNASMSVTWPRSGGSVYQMKATNQISADTSKLTGVQNSVKTNVSRPQSKPRTRNPLNSIKQQTISQNSAPRDSPTQVEKEFLSSANGGSESISVPTGWGETSWDEEYFNTIPEDITILNSSLSSSLSSLCTGKTDLENISSEVDKLKHIRKEAASRKAQLISAASSAFNSPDSSRQSSGEARGRPSNQGEGAMSTPAKKPKRPKPQPLQVPPQVLSQQPDSSRLNATFTTPQSKWLPDDSSDPTISLSRTYNPGGQEKSYAAAYAAKKQGSQLKSFKSSHSQKDRERLLAEGSKVVMSLEEPDFSSEVSSRGKKRLQREQPVAVRSSSLGGTDMIDMEIGGVSQRQKPVEQSVKSQSVAYSSSKKPPLPPTTDTSEPFISAPPESVRKRSKQKKSPPLKSCEEIFEESHHRELDMSQNGSPEGLLQELYPFDSPEAGLRDSLQQMERDDWNSKVEGIVGVRRLATYHPDVLLPRLQTVVFAVEKEVKNLRSSVARAAITCFGSLFASMGSTMEKELDGVVKVLLHKGAESNTFIREDMEKALYEMIAHISHHKCLTALINGGLKHKNPQVRKTTSKHICLILEAQGPSKFLHSSKDLLDRTLPAIVLLAGDNSVEPRYYGKRCLHQLWPLPDFERVCTRTLSGILLSKAKDMVESLRTKGLGDPPAESHSAKNRLSIGGTVRVSSNKPLSSNYTDGGPTPVKEVSSKKQRRSQSTSSTDSPCVDVPLPEGLLDKLKSSSWSERYEGVTELEEFVNIHPKALAPYLLKVFDVFCPRLTDRNSKVNLRALEAFSNIVTLLCDTLTPVTTHIVNALVPNLASRNSTIHSKAMTALDLLSQCIDPAYLIQPIANSAQFGNARVRPIMINKLADLTVYIAEQKPQLVSRQVLPVLWHLLSAKAPLTGDSRTAACFLCEALLSTIGPQLLEDSASHLSPEVHKKLDDLMSSLNR